MDSVGNAANPGNVGNTIPGYGVGRFAFETGRHYKVHKSYIWLGPALAVLAVLVVAVLNSIPALVQLFGYLRETGVGMNVLLGVGIGLLALAALYGLTTLLYYLGYKNLSYVFDEREFSLYSGIITKRRVHVPYARVQSVNHRASVLQRIVGVCSVSIDTAGGAGNKAVRIPYVTLDVAEAMRTELFLRKAVAAGEVPIPTAAAAAQVPAAAQAYGIPAANVLEEAAGEVGDWRGIYAGQIAGLEPASFERGLTNRELLLTSASHSAPLWIAFSIGFTALIIMMGLSFGEDMGLPRFVVVWMLPLTIISVIGSWLLGAVGIAISYGNYRVRRRGSRIEVERGLLQRSFSGIDISRVQSIEIRQSLVRRLIGYCEVSLGRINSSEQDGSNSSSQSTQRGLVIHPFIKVDQVDALLDQLVPEFSERPREAQMMKLPAVAMRRALLRRCLWFNPAFYVGVGIFALYLIARAYFGVSSPAVFLQSLGLGTTIVLVCCVIFTAITAVNAVIWSRESGFLWNPRYASIRNGGLWSTTVTVPRQKIQSGSTRSNPFQRMQSLTSLHLTTAAGSRSTTTVLLDVPQEAGEAWLTWLKPRKK